MFESLDQEANATQFGLLVGKSQQAISKHVASGLLIKGQSYRQWLRYYCDHLSTHAAGRGGEKQVDLAQAKVEELTVKTELLALQRDEKLKLLCITEDVQNVLSDWASYTSREQSALIDKLILTIENKHNIEVDPELVNDIAFPVIQRIKDYAGKLARSLIAGV